MENDVGMSSSLADATVSAVARGEAEERIDLADRVEFIGEVGASSRRVSSVTIPSFE